jgi:TM2 domain-containing membrane protein YozV
MFCRECGKEVKDGAVACLACGVRPLDGANHCQECGAETKTKQVVCIKCGMQLVGLTGKEVGAAKASTKIMPSNPPKSPTLALVLSIFITGLGPIYLGQVKKGLTMLGVAVVLGIITAGILYPVLVVANLVVGTVDAYKIGRKLESGKSVDEWEFF